MLRDFFFWAFEVGVCRCWEAGVLSGGSIGGAWLSCRSWDICDEG